MTRRLSDYLELHYRYELVADPDEGGFFARHPELSCCFAQGETADEAVAELDAAREVWIEARLEEELPIPQPREAGPPNGGDDARELPAGKPVTRHGKILS